MANIAQLIYAPEVQDKASGPLDAIAQAADRTGASIERLDTRVRRNETSFADAAGRLDVVERAANKVERATAGVTRAMEAAERAALAEGVAQDRLNAVLASGAQARESAALAAVRGLTAEQQAAALTRAGYANLATQVQATAQAQSNLGVRAATGLAAANDNAAQSSGRMRQALGQAGFQVQDFATQVSMGQNALMAFGVQGAQLAGIFGPAGAIAGAGLMIGVIAAQLLGMGESAAQAEARIRTAFDAIKTDGQAVTDVIRGVADLFKTAAERAADLARSQRDVLAASVDIRLSNAIQMQDAAATRIPTLEREIAVLERRAAVEQEIARRAGRGGGLGAPLDQTTDTTSALFVARSQLNGLRSEMDLMDRRIRDLNTARQGVQTAEQLGIGEISLDVRAQATRSAAQADEELLAAMRAVQDAQKDHDRLMQEGASITASVRTEAEKYADQLSVLNTLLGQGAITQETFNRAVAAADPAAKAAREAAQQVERDNKSTTDSIVRYAGDRFADLFSGNQRSWAQMWQGFLSTARSTLARIAAEAIIRPIIAPIVSSLGLGQVGSVGGISNLLGISGTLGGPGAASNAGSITGATNQLGQFGALNAAGQYGNLGAAFGGTGFAGTGYSGLDSLLNYQLVAPSGVGSVLPAGVSGPLAPAGTGLTAAGAIGGVAGIAGGAYGIYSGLQRGGPGGYTSAAGGALGVASGISSILASLGVISAGLGPIGWIGAAVLAIAGALLPGQKASGRGQEAKINLNSGAESFNGLGGDRFSQGNRDAAGNAVNQIADLAKSIGQKLGGATIGGDLIVGATSSRGDGPGTLYLNVNGIKSQFANDEEGSKALAEEAAKRVLYEFRKQDTVQGDYRSILFASGDSTDALQQNLKWYEEVYKTFDLTTPKVSAFDQSLKSVEASMNAVIDKAQELGLSTDLLVEARAREIAKVTEQRDAQLFSFRVGLDIRNARVRGDNQSADLMQFDLQTTSAVAEAKTSLESLGLSAADVLTEIARLERTLTDERLGIQKQYQDQALALAKQAADEQMAQIESGAGGALGVVTSLRSYVQGLSTTDASAGTAVDRFQAAQRQFDAIFGAAVAGDANSISGLQSAAETYRTNARDVFGGGQGYADVLAQIGDRLDGIASQGDQVLTQAFITANARENTDRLVDELRSLRSEVAQMRADQNIILMRPAA